jgi:TolB protein
MSFSSNLLLMGVTMFQVLICCSMLCAIGTNMAPEPMLAGPVQLTFSSEFHKAGESYFSDDGTRLIFQAVPAVAEGESPDEHYGMYVSEVIRDDANVVNALHNTRRISPPDSANTCGWFYPGRRDRVLFATTTTAPFEAKPPGYQRESGDYRWQFPPEMNIIAVDLDKADGTANDFEPLVSDDSAYLAEGSVSPDGRHLLYTSLATGDGDLWVKDLHSGDARPIVEAPGYDGGPFFSPDGRRITYRSDRNLDDLLQVYVADLEFSEAGSILGIVDEHQITRNEHVNWCPFWTCDGRSLVYATSQIGHHNYEIFIVDADAGGDGAPLRYGTGVQRVTIMPGFDGLPAFSSDGRSMVWTSKRSGAEGSQLWVSPFDQYGGADPAVGSPVIGDEH